MDRSVFCFLLPGLFFPSGRISCLPGVTVCLTRLSLLGLLPTLVCLLVQHKFSGRLNNYIQLAIRFHFAMCTVNQNLYRFKTEYFNLNFTRTSQIYDKLVTFGLSATVNNITKVRMKYFSQVFRSPEFCSYYNPFGKPDVVFLPQED